MTALRSLLGFETESATGKALPMVLAAALASPAAAGVGTVFDQTAWDAIAGGPESIRYIDFGTVPYGAFVTDQFASLGVHFTDGDDMRVNVFVPALAGR